MRREQTAHNESSTKTETALNNKLHRKKCKSQSEMRKNKTKGQRKRFKKNNERAKRDHVDQWQSMTNCQHTARTLHTGSDSGKDSKGSMQTYRIQFMGNTTSKFRVGRQKERAQSYITDSDVYSAEVYRKLWSAKQTSPISRSLLFPMQTIIAQIRHTMKWHFIRTCTKSCH